VGGKREGDKAGEDTDVLKPKAQDSSRRAAREVEALRGQGWEEMPRSPAAVGRSPAAIPRSPAAIALDAEEERIKKSIRRLEVTLQVSSRTYFIANTFYGEHILCI
jgi:hypothetical protein